MAFCFVTLAVHLFLTRSAVATVVSNTTFSSSQCCSALSAALESKVFYPASAAYSRSLATYFSNQEAQLTPLCIVFPTQPQDVAKAVTILSAANLANHNSCSFAIKSGGHTAFAGSANIDSGITIDLAELNEITVSPDNTLTIVGAGQRWGAVYERLVPMNLMVVGGKSAPVGIGGTTTGGGMSAFSPRKGFVCDNVVIFEAVLADGRLVNATQTHHSDLWLALKGGSNNFAIVTRFFLRTFSQGDVWAGSLFYDISTAPQHLKAFNDFDLSTDYDEDAIVIVSFGYQAAGSAVVNTLEYAKPVINPSSLAPFTAIQPQLSNTMKIANYSAVAKEQASFNTLGLRQLFITTTFYNSLDMLTTGYHMWNTTIPALAAVPGLQYSITYQPIPPAMTSRSAALGGNSLGLESFQRALVLALVSVAWQDPSDDGLVEHTVNTLISSIDGRAKAAGRYHPFKYLNYANRGQSVFDGYGTTNKNKLKATSRKYDRFRIFQDAVPGGFKLFTQGKHQHSL